jgi:hypothetical protein
MKNGVFWDVNPCGSCKNRRFVGFSASIIRVTRISELVTKLAVTSNRSTLRRLYSLHLDDEGAKFLPNFGSKSHTA